MELRRCSHCGFHRGLRHKEVRSVHSSVFFFLSLFKSLGRNGGAPERAVESELHCVKEEGGRILGFEICRVLAVLHGTHSLMVVRVH